MKKASQNKINKLFRNYACDLFDKMCENTEILCEKIFPGQPISREIFVLACDRMIIETAAVLEERKGKKNVKRKKKVATAETNI